MHRAGGVTLTFSGRRKLLAFIFGTTLLCTCTKEKRIDAYSIRQFDAQEFDSITFKALSSYVKDQNTRATSKVVKLLIEDSADTVRCTVSSVNSFNDLQDRFNTIGFLDIDNYTFVVKANWQLIFDDGNNLNELQRILQTRVQREFFEKDESTFNPAVWGILKVGDTTIINKSARARDLPLGRLKINKLPSTN